MANLNNPAGRLLYWLEQGQKRRQDQSAMAEWCTVFDLDQSKIADRVECMRRGAMLMGLAQEVRREAEQLPEGYHQEVMLANFGEVESALDHFTILQGTHLQNMYAPIQGTGWQSLRMLDAMLSSHRPEQVIEHDTIHEHIEQVRNLIDSILADDDLDADLKRYMVARLRDVEKALVDSLITGAPGLELAANSLLGARDREPDWWDRIAQTKWAPRIGALWMAIVTTLGAAGGAPALMPGGDDSSTRVEIHHSVTVDGTPRDDNASDDVVEGEFVEDEPEGGREPPR